MRKIGLALLGMIALLSALSIPAVSAAPMKPLRCEVTLELNWNWEGFPWGTPGSKYTWILTISGDVEGNGGGTLIGATYMGILERYSETWHIVTAHGTIDAYQEGIWSFKTFKFKSNGWVTAATGSWAYLLGSDMHVRGVTTQFPVPIGTPVTGAATMWICGFGP